MKYIIMAGGNYGKWDTPRQLSKVNGEVVIERTIRLLKENGIKDIAVSTNSKAFDYLGIPILIHDNSYESKDGKISGYWVDAFYPTDDPICYIFGDVYFSEEAIKTIINTKTNDIELFGSAPPFADIYPKYWIEPFALKVNNTKHLKEAIQKTKELTNEGKTWRKNPIMWDLWTVIKEVPLQTKADEYIYNYTAINDYTSDIDDKKDIDILEIKIGGSKMVKVQCILDYNDLQLNKLVTTKDDPYTVTKERAEELVSKNVAKVVEVIPEAEKPVAKKTTKKK